MVICPRLLRSHSVNLRDPTTLTLGMRSPYPRRVYARGYSSWRTGSRKGDAGKRGREARADAEVCLCPDRRPRCRREGDTAVWSL